MASWLATLTSTAISTAAVAGLIWASGPQIHDNARELFREAVTAGKQAGREDQEYIFSEIAKAQAEHGYFDDALVTLPLTGQFRDSTLRDLVNDRAKRGDIAGAEQMAKLASTRAAQWDAKQAIAFAQVYTGDLRGARATMQLLPARLKQNVLQSIGIAQADDGDIEGALKTVAGMEAGWSDGVLFEIALELRERGDKQRALKIANRIVNAGMKSVALAGGSYTSPEHKDPCQLALEDASHGTFAEAYNEIKGRKCRCDLVAVIHVKARDVEGAEHAMRMCTDLNPSDISARMIDVAKTFAAQGDIEPALKFAEAARVPGAYQGGEGYIAPAFRDIAHAWVKRDGASSVLKWARSRPTGYQRAMALLGAAETIPGATHGSTASK